MLNAGNLKIYLIASAKNLVLTPSALKLLEEKVK
jgi:hypothetical protein